jgi:vesicular inhibitory amino acid transporter
VNSIDNFVRSWNRAAHYLEIHPRPSFSLSVEDEDEDEDEENGAGGEGEGSGHEGSMRRTMLRQHMEASGHDEALTEDTDDNYSDDGQPEVGSRRRRPSSRLNSTKPFGSQSAMSPLFGSHKSGHGFTYGSISTGVERKASMQDAGTIWSEGQHGKHDEDRAPLLIKQVEEDGKIITVVVGQSTLPQTIFNSVNVLIGIGLLSLPLGLRYSGWVFGLVFLTFAALVTAYTARILAKCLEIDTTLATFSDLAYISFGPMARLLTSVLFCLELLAACVALVVLFGDSLYDLDPSLDKTTWKIICGFVLFPLCCLPLRILSFTSILGIFCSVSIVLIVIVDGLLKSQSPGSLLHPAKTYLFPENWLTIPLSIGLLMSPWGGNSVFPNIYRDMRHPKKFNRNISISFISTYCLDLTMGVVGLLMFGDAVKDEVTGNILLTKGYPQGLNVCIVVLIAIIPLTKVPLNARPIITLLERIFGVDAIAISDSESLVGLSTWTRGIIRLLIRLFCVIMFVVVAIIFPAFDSIMAFLGSALCFTICVILPLAFHLKLFGKEIPLWERVLNWVLIVACSIMASMGTIWAFLPKEKIGAAGAQRVIF